MTGLEEFEKIFGNITVLNVLELALAVAFVIFLYKKGKKYILAKNAEDEEKNRQLKTALDAVSKYPEYRAQSIKIQKVLREMTVTPGWEPPALLNDFYEEVVE